MAYTVKQVAAMSGVSVRTLHFYDEIGLLHPAYQGANGYRYYEDAQLLVLQQVLFYRELGFELKKIKRILGRADFEKIGALRSHRKVLRKNLARTRVLIQTINKTIGHLKGEQPMKGEEIFAGFSVAAGEDRFGEHIKVGEGYSLDCKLSAQDTQGAMCIFEFTTGWPRHLHRDQDEWVYVVEGEADFEVGGKRFRLGVGESAFIPRKVAHGFGPVDDEPARFIHVFQPAGNMEAFFRVLGNLDDIPTKEQAINNRVTDEQIDSLRRLFDAHGMDLLGPSVIVE